MAFRTFVRALILSLVICLPSFAEWPYDAVGDVSCATPYGQVFGGSGTLISATEDGKKGLIVSCYHVFDEGVAEAWITFIPTGEKRWTLHNLANDPVRDISIWLIVDPPQIQPPAGVTKVKPEDGPFVAVGFPGYGEGNQHFNMGEFISYDQNGYEAYVDMGVHSGYSGGALFNKHGQYCGIVCGNTVLLNGTPVPEFMGTWESRHTTGDDFLRMIETFMPVIK